MRMSKNDFFWGANWRQSFCISPEHLAGGWTFFSEILPHLREIPEPSFPEPKSDTLSDMFIQALLYAAELKPNAYDSFEYYLENGELEAASILIEAAAAVADISTMALQRRLGQQQRALEDEYARLRAQLQHLHS